MTTMHTTTNEHFTNDTLRALGLNEAGVRAARFVVVCRTHSTRTGRVLGVADRCTTAAAADAVYHEHRAAGRDAMIQVWWSGDCTPVREWSLAPLTTEQKAAAALGLYLMAYKSH